VQENKKASGPIWKSTENIAHRDLIHAPSDLYQIAIPTTLIRPPTTIIVITIIKTATPLSGRVYQIIGY
jgi:hypothetical protein